MKKAIFFLLEISLFSANAVAVVFSYLNHGTLYANDAHAMCQCFRWWKDANTLDCGIVFFFSFLFDAVVVVFTLLSTDYGTFDDEDHENFYEILKRVTSRVILFIYVSLLLLLTVSILKYKTFFL